MAIRQRTLVTFSRAAQILIIGFARRSIIGPAMRAQLEPVINFWRANPLKSVLVLADNLLRGLNAKGMNSVLASNLLKMPDFLTFEALEMLVGASQS
jgi:hypothetical protein